MAWPLAVSRVGPNASAAGAPAPTDPNPWVEPRTDWLLYHTASQSVGLSASTASDLLDRYSLPPSPATASRTSVKDRCFGRRSDWAGGYSAGGEAPFGAEGTTSFGMRNTNLLDFGLFCFTRLWGDMR